MRPNSIGSSTRLKLLFSPFSKQKRQHTRNVKSRKEERDRFFFLRKPHQCIFYEFCAPIECKRINKKKRIKSCGEYALVYFHIVHQSFYFLRCFIIFYFWNLFIFVIYLYYFFALICMVKKLNYWKNNRKSFIFMLKIRS